MKRTARWVFFAGRIITAEFPDLQLMWCFKVFSLAKKADARNDLAASKPSLDMIANMLKLPSQELFHQYSQMYPLAERVFDCERCNNLEAWRRTLEPGSVQARCVPNFAKHVCALTVVTIGTQPISAFLLCAFI